MIVYLERDRLYVADGFAKMNGICNWTLAEVLCKVSMRDITIASGLLPNILRRTSKDIKYFYLTYYGTSW